jgi:hypothetical protein
MEGVAIISLLTFLIGYVFGRDWFGIFKYFEKKMKS